MFAEAIKEERRNLSHTQFASAINTSKESEKEANRRAVASYYAGSNPND